jgi:hypothetical protein
MLGVSLDRFSGRSSEKPTTEANAVRNALDNDASLAAAAPEFRQGGRPIEAAHTLVNS